MYIGINPNDNYSLISLKTQRASKAIIKLCSILFELGKHHLNLLRDQCIWSKQIIVLFFFLDFKILEL